MTHAVLPLSDEMSGSDDAADASEDANVRGSLTEPGEYPTGGVANDPSSADSLVFTVPIDGEGGPRK